MEVFKFNRVFDHIEIALRDLLGKNPKYNKTVFVLGYNVLQNLNDIKLKYTGYKVIIYQLEQLYTGSTWVNRQSFYNLRAADEIWDYDQSNIDWMRNNYKLNAKFVPLMYTEALNKLPIITEDTADIDVLFYGYMHERRAKLLFYLQQKFAGKFKVFDLYGIWGDELDSYIERSKIILNLHSSEDAKQEQVRMFYPVINGRCVVSEKSPHNYMGDSIIEIEYNKLGDGIISLLNNGMWKKQANVASDKYKRLSTLYRNNIQM